MAARLYRSEKNRVVGGVAAGLAEYLDLDPTLIRALFVIVTILGGSGILVYLVLWLIMPSYSETSGTGEEHIKKNVEEMQEKARVFTKGGNSRYLVGIILLVLGIGLLFENFGLPSFALIKLWPVLLIILAFSMLSKK